MATSVIFLTSGSTWTVPNDWNNSNNTIECIGAGGGGSAMVGQAGYGEIATGGGGGAYSKISNLSLTYGANISISVGTGGACGIATYGNSPQAATNGGSTWFNGTALSSASVSAQGGAAGTYKTGGGGGISVTGSSGGLASAGIGTIKYSGGNSGSMSNGSPCSMSSGGGGAAGPNGPGIASASSTANGTASNGGNGDNNYGGSGGISGATGNPGTEYTTAGSGGGGGATGYGSGQAGSAGNGGLYGGGGGGAFGTNSNAINGGLGAQGLIIITYVPSSNQITPQFIIFTMN